MPLRGTYTISSPDLREALQIAPAIQRDLYQRFDAKVATRDGKPSRTGITSWVGGEYVRPILQFRGFSYPKKPQVCSFLMCKGGVGKTTSTFFLAQRLSAYGARVLVIDSDPQGNLSSAFKLETMKHPLTKGTPVLVDVVRGKCSLEDTIIEVTPSLHLVPSTPLNSILEGRLREQFKNPSVAFSEMIEDVKKSYDYVLFDCAPALGLVNTAIVCASDLIVLPAAPDPFSEMGLEQTMREIEQVEKAFRIKVQKKVLLTKFDQRERSSLKYLANILQNCNENRFSTVIRVSSDVKNVIISNADLFALPKSSARKDYDQFTREFLGLDPKTLVKATRAGRRTAA